MLETRADEIGRLAGHFTTATIGVADQSCGVDNGDQALRVIQNLCVEIVLAQELRLHILHLRDVEEHTAVLHYLSGFVTDDEAVS